MKIDVRCKLLLLLAISIMSFLVKDLFFGTLLFLVVCLISFSMGLRKTVLKFSLVYGVLVGVELLAPVMPMALKSILLMLVLCIRMFMPMLLYGRVFIDTTRINEMITAMYALKIPRSLTITLAVALRFFPTAKEEISFIKDAMRLRGLEISFKNVILHPNLLFESLMVPMMMRSSTIAEELAAASITRGIDNPQLRSSFEKLKLRGVDIVFAVLGLSFLGGVLFLKYKM